MRKSENVQDFSHVATSKTKKQKKKNKKKTKKSEVDRKIKHILEDLSSTLTKCCETHE